VVIEGICRSYGAWEFDDYDFYKYAAPLALGMAGGKDPAKDGLGWTNGAKAFEFSLRQGIFFLAVRNICFRS